MSFRNYIIAFVSAIVLAIAAWLVVPHKYAAKVKLCDEYKETDLAVGLDQLSAKIKKMMNSNVGINDMEVYANVLNSDEFARKISHKKLEGRNATYGEYLNTDDTIGTIKDNIYYNYSSRKNTLIIQFTDDNPEIAAQMLDSVTVELQKFISEKRRFIATKKFDNETALLSSAKESMEKSRNDYGSYADSHRNTKTESVRQEMNLFQGILENSQKEYENSVRQSVRQKMLSKRSYSSFAIIRSNTVPTHKDTHLGGWIVAFVVLSLLLAKGYSLYKKRKQNPQKIQIGGLFSPWSITIGVWAAVIASIIFSGDLMDPLTSQFYTSISIWVPILCITSFVTFNLMEQKTPAADHEFKVNMTMFNALYIIAMIITPLYLYQIYKLVSMFDTQDLMNNVRELAIHGDGYGFLNYTFVVNEVLLLTALWLYPKIKWWQLTTIIIACILYAIGNMEKITVFLLFISSMFVLFERRVISVRTIVVIGLFLLIGFYFFNLARSGEDSNYSKNETLFDFIGMYILSGPVAYCKLHQNLSDQFGSDTLWGVYLYLSKWLSGDFIPHTPFQEFVTVPMWTNVYTVMRPFYTDFGNTGVAFFAFLYGVLLGVAYRLKTNGNNFGTCLYTYFVYVLTLQFFDEFITANLPLFGQMLILLAIITQNRIKFSFKKITK